MTGRCQKQPLSRYTAKAFMWILLPTLLVACAFSRLKTDVTVGEHQWQLILNAKSAEKPTGQLVAVVYTPYKDAQRIAAFRIIDPAIGGVVFMFQPGVYRAALFHDKNENLLIDADEPVELVEQGRRLKFSDVAKRIELDVDVPTKSSLPKGYPRELASLPESIQGNYHLAFGELMNIKESRFSESAGRLGLWEPTRFLKEYGGGVYMLEQYDAQKTPVLFINGAGGSAQNWSYFFRRLDKNNFAAWYLLYPSGMRIKRVGKALNTIIRTMQTKLGIKRLHIVAHSMGGLVARETIVNHLNDGKPPIIDLLITLSTPWNGHPMASKGVRALSTPIPSWHDMVPGSPFLQTVFETPLKPKVEHHLLFGYNVGSEGDGTIDLSSMLLSEAQDDAVEVRGFEADHVAILTMDTVFDYVENILINKKHRVLSEQPQDAGSRD